jgi:hypothetical protein
MRSTTRQVNGGTRRLRLSVAWLAAIGVLLAAAVPAQAHWADLAVAEIVVGETKAEITLAFPTGLVAWADDNRNGQLSAAEVRAYQPRLEAFLAERIRLTDGGRPGALAVRAADEPAGTHSTLLLVYTWPSPVRTVRIHYGLFLPGVSTASCLATILQGGRVQSVVFTPESREFTVEVGRQAVWQQATGFVMLGIEHIMSGYDHILFLLSLLMLGGGLRYLVKVVSAFTVAHSLTLSLAVLNVVLLPTRWVVSAIALSIVYVATENFWRKERALRDRWLITFGFGLVHGLGFASILKDMVLPRANLAVSLASFNVGVEIGQVAIVAIAYLLLQLVRAWARDTIVRRFVSAAAATAGVFWFIQRAILPL